MITEEKVEIATGVEGVNGPIIIRKAMIKDVPQIFKLVNQMARLKNNLLPRSMSELYEHVRDFFVVADGDKIIGCCSLHIFWADLAEVRSLAVDMDYQGQGWGEKLMEIIIEDGRQMSLTRLMVLTTIPQFFEKFEFIITNKENLPQKAWSECFRCPKFTECDETALVLNLVADSEIPGDASMVFIKAAPRVFELKPR